MIVKLKHCLSPVVTASVITLRSTEGFFQLPLVPHHVLESREGRRSTRSRNLRLHGKEQQVDALYQGYGTHYIDLWVGTPPQRQTVIVGTGMGLTAFPCSKCTDCGETHHTDSYFIEADSSTYVKTPCDQCRQGKCYYSSRPEAEGECRIHKSFLEGSTWHAYESKDIAYAGGPHDKIQKLPDVFTPQDQDDVDPKRASNFAFNLTFGCQYRTTGLFATQLADGEMGMANIPNSFWAQAYEHGVIDNKFFSLCLSRQPTASWQGTEAGALTLGGVDTRLHTSPMVYSTLRPNLVFKVKLRKMYLRQGGGGDSAASTDPNLNIVPLNVPERRKWKGLDTDDGLIEFTVDSGTTDTYLTEEIASAFEAAWLEFTGKQYSHAPISLTKEELNNLPTILFQIVGDSVMNGKLQDPDDPEQVVGLTGSLDPEHPLDVILAMPPAHYMEFYKKQLMYVARVYTDDSNPTIGANAMMGHDITFDADKNRVGFAESHCDYTKLVEEVEEEEEAEAKEIHQKDRDKKVEHGKSANDLQETNASTTHKRNSWGRIVLAGLVMVGVVGMLAFLKMVHGPSMGQYEQAEVEVPDWQATDEHCGPDPDGLDRARYEAPSFDNNVEIDKEQDRGREESAGYDEVPKTSEIA